MFLYYHTVRLSSSAEKQGFLEATLKCKGNYLEESHMHDILVIVPKCDRFMYKVYYLGCLSDTCEQLRHLPLFILNDSSVLLYRQR